MFAEAMAVASIVSGIGDMIGNKKNEKRQQAANDYNKNEGGKLDLGLLRSEAESNGFNALTVLRNTGGYGFTNGYAQATQYTSPLSIIGDTISNAGAAYMGVTQFQDDRLESAQRNRESVARSGLYQAETVRQVQLASGGGSVVRGSAPVSVATLGDPSIALEDGRGTVTNPFKRDGKWVDPAFPDAEMAEARYSDVLSNLFGLNTVLQDYRFNNVMERIEGVYGSEKALEFAATRQERPSVPLVELIYEMVPESTFSPSDRSVNVMSEAPSLIAPVAPSVRKYYDVPPPINFYDKTPLTSPSFGF